MPSDLIRGWIPVLRIEYAQVLTSRTPARNDIGVRQLRRWSRLSGHGAHPMAFVVIKRRAIFGAGGRHRRAAPGPQDHQRGSLAQYVVQARHPVTGVHAEAESGIAQTHPSLKTPL